MYSLFFRQYGRIMHKKTAKAAVLYVFHKVYLYKQFNSHQDLLVTDFILL